MESVVVIGGGVNGLVCAAYLARSGMSVKLLEACPDVGGMCKTEMLLPDSNVSSLAGWSGMLPNHIYEELNLVQHGLEFLAIDNDITLLSDGQWMGELNGYLLQEIHGWNSKEEERWNRLTDDKIETATKIKSLFHNDYPVKRKQVEQLLKENFLTRSGLDPFLSSWWDLLIERPTTNGARSVAATSTLNTHPYNPGTIYHAIYLSTTETNGVRGRWGFPKGGMGSLTKALTKSAQSFGVDISVNTEARELKLSDKTVATGVVDVNGELHQAKNIVIATDLWSAHKMFPANMQGTVPKILTDAKLHNSTASAKVHILVSEIPDTASGPSLNNFPQFTLGLNKSHLDTLWNDNSRTSTSKNNILTVANPSILDNTVSPPGKFAPGISVYSVGIDATERSIEESTINQLNAALPGFRDAVEHTHTISPASLAKRYKALSGHCFHWPIASDVFTKTHPSIRHPFPHLTISGLYLAGSTAFPGGTASGWPGFRCAMALIKDSSPSKNSDKNNVNMFLHK